MTNSDFHRSAVSVDERPTFRPFFEVRENGCFVMGDRDDPKWWVELDAPEIDEMRRVLNAAQAVGDSVLLPRKLTAENGAKAALIGEFSETVEIMDEDGEEHPMDVPVSWDTIKRIWVAAVAHFDASQPSPAATVETDTSEGCRCMFCGARTLTTCTPEKPAEGCLRPRLSADRESEIAKRASEFIRTNDPFGDHFSSRDLQILAGEPASLQAQYEDCPCGGNDCSAVPGGPLYNCPYAAQPQQSAGNEDVRWAVNYLLEQIAAKFEAWETFDLFRSEAAETVRSFKHDLIAHGAQNLAQDAEKGTTLDTARVTQILERHIKLDWLNASDGKPDLVGIEEAAAELLRGEPQGAPVTVPSSVLCPHCGLQGGHSRMCQDGQ
jgi:hypothetical protein